MERLSLLLWYFDPFFEILLLSYFRHFFARNVSYGSILKTPKQENTNVLSISRSQLGHQIVSIVVIWPLHAFSLMGLLIDISSFHDNIQSPPNYETISYSMSSSRSQQTRPCVPKATPYKGCLTVLWTSVPEGQSCAKHVIIYIENIRLENFVLRTFLLSSGHPGPTGNTINKDLDLCKRASDWKIDLLSFRCTGMNTQNLYRNTK